MQGLKRFVAGVLIAMATVAIAPSALAQEQDSPPASTVRVSETGPESRSLRPGADVPPARAAQDSSQPPDFEVTDGAFTDDEPEIVLAISNCASNVVTAESPIFASATYDPAARTVTADIEPATESGSFPVTITCQGQPSLNGELTIDGGSSDDEITVSAEGTFTDEDPRIRITVTGCDSNEVTAESPIFDSSSFDEETGVITARVEEGTESGSFPLTVTCEGQPTLETEIEIDTGDDDSGDGGGGTTTPRGGVDAGHGGTAGGSPDAGWLLLPLLGATGAGLIVLRRRHATDR